MSKEEWGVKRVCPTSGKRFYDLNKTPVVSPYTGEVVELATGKSRSIRPDTEDAETKKTKGAKSEQSSDESGDNNEDVVLEDDLLEDDENDNDNVSLDDIADVESGDNDM